LLLINIVKYYIYAQTVLPQMFKR